MNSTIIRWIKIVVMRTLREKNLTRLDTQLLVSAGMLGYTQALSRYRDDRGAKLKTFAEYRIKGAVLDEVRKLIGDERSKNPRPRRVEIDFTLIGDGGMTQDHLESALDLQSFFANACLSEREKEVLYCKLLGMDLAEIAAKFEFSESRASQLLARVKRQVFRHYHDRLRPGFKLRSWRCPECGISNVVSDKVREFSCDGCNRTLTIFAAGAGGNDSGADDVRFGRSVAATR